VNPTLYQVASTTADVEIGIGAGLLLILIVVGCILFAWIVTGDDSEEVQP
jgi:hypothetical protein